MNRLQFSAFTPGVTRYPERVPVLQMETPSIPRPLTTESYATALQRLTRSG